MGVERQHIRESGDFVISPGFPGLLALLLIPSIAFAGGFNPPGGSGDITGVTAGVGMSGGGVSGEITIGANPSSTTLQGNTFNGTNQLVKTDGSGRLPAIDGSLLTGVTASGDGGIVSPGSFTWVNNYGAQMSTINVTFSGRFSNTSFPLNVNNPNYVGAYTTGLNFQFNDLTQGSIEQRNYGSTDGSNNYMYNGPIVLKPNSVSTLYVSPGYASVGPLTESTPVMRSTFSVLGNMSVGSTPVEPPLNGLYVQGAIKNSNLGSSLGVCTDGSSNLTTSGCSFGISANSPLAVTVGPARSSPTYDIMFNPSQMAGSISGSTITISLDPSSVTLQGNTIGGDVSGSLSNISVTDDSHAHSGASLSGIDISDDTNLSAQLPLSISGDQVQIDKSSATLVGPTIDLGAETDGNYVASVAAADPLLGGAGGSEGAAISLDIDRSSFTLLGPKIDLNSTTEVNGTLGVGSGGTNLTSAADNVIMVGNGSAWESKTISECTSSQKIQYTETTNSFSCATDQSGVAWGAITGTLSSQSDLSSRFDSVSASTNSLQIQISAISSMTVVASTGNFVIAGTGLTSIPSMSVGLAANTTYFFEYYMLFRTTTTTTGARFAVEAPAAGGTLSIQYNVGIPQAADANNGMFHGWGTSSDDAVVGIGVQATNTTYVAEIKGIIVTGTGGNLTPRAACELAGSTQVTIMAPSIGTIRKL